MILVKMLLEEAVRANEDKKYLRIWIQAAFVFAGVWGIGGNLDTDSQIQYDEFYKTLWKGEWECFVTWNVSVSSL